MAGTSKRQWWNWVESGSAMTFRLCHTPDVLLSLRCRACCHTTNTVLLGTNSYITLTIFLLSRRNRTSRLVFASRCISHYEAGGRSVSLTWSSMAEQLSTASAGPHSYPNANGPTEPSSTRTAEYKDKHHAVARTLFNSLRP